VKAVLLRVGKGRTKWADAAVEDYARRFRKQLAVEEVLVKPATHRGDVAGTRDEEAARILARLKPGDLLIALDERGEVVTTEAFTGWLDAAAREGVGRVVFAIGGPYGHGPAVRARAQHVLAFGRMVVNHELARILLVEQLYRASTLMWGGSYHH
jgi:23S rRNA (pseudouridine1915-N3)-methyltransferase